MPLLLATLAEAEGGGFSFTDFNFALTLWTIVLFALFAFVMTKFGWGPLLKIVKDREHSIRDAVEGAHKAKADAEALLEKHRQMLDELTQSRGEIIKTAQQEGDRLRAELQAQAKADGDRLIERAKEQIERQKGEAIRELRGEVANLAVEAASKIVTSSLTPEAQKKLVTDFLSSLPRA
jgi:F-type H+-transporting ATPase subunit b